MMWWIMSDGFSTMRLERDAIVPVAEAARKTLGGRDAPIWPHRMDQCHCLVQT
jgi:hypothetical protein